MEQFIEPAITIALVSGVVEAFKRFGVVDKKLAYPTALIVGIGAAFLSYSTIGTVILTGIGYGLASAGLYDGVKKLPKPNLKNFTPTQ